MVSSRGMRESRQTAAGTHARLDLPRELPRVGEAHVRRDVAPQVLRPPRPARRRLNEHAEQLHVLALLVQLEEARTRGWERLDVVEVPPLCYRRTAQRDHLHVPRARARGRGGRRISLPVTTIARGGHSMPVGSLAKTTCPSLSCRLRLPPLRECARAGGPWAERLVPAGRTPLGGKALGGAARAG